MNGCLMIQKVTLHVFSNNGTSVVDYMMASTSLFSKVCHFKFAELDIQDHLSVFCTFNFKKDREHSDVPEENISLNKWMQYK